MSRTQAVRLVALCAQVEMALVRDDPVAAPLAAQAARAARGGECERLLAEASRLTREPTASAGAPRAARRKAIQALVRAAAQRAQAAVLA